MGARSSLALALSIFDTHLSEFQFKWNHRKARGIFALDNRAHEATDGAGAVLMIGGSGACAAPPFKRFPPIGTNGKDANLLACPPPTVLARLHTPIAFKVQCYATRHTHQN